MPFQRTGKFPIDRSNLFSSYTDAVAYALGDGLDSRELGKTSYVGQIIVVFENDVVTAYKINADRTIEALTSKSGVDALDAAYSQSISVNANGKATANHIGFQLYQQNGKITSFSIDEKDIASAYDLSEEIKARKAVDGQTGQTYAKNTAYTHISAATSLNDADIRLNNAITAETKARQDAINALDATLSGNGTHVDVTVVQTNGKLSSVTVAESDIASASALTSLTNWCAYMSGHTTATALTSVLVTKRMCVATISSSQTLGIANGITDGREVHIIVKNSGSSEITITIPSTLGGKTCINMLGENLIMQGNSYGEINLLSDGTNIYYRGAAL